MLKFHRLRELEFPSLRESAISTAVSHAEHDADNDEKPRGLRPWESVRASKVQRARELLKDPGYPSKKVLEGVADVLAEGLTVKRQGRPAPERPND